MVIVKGMEDLFRELETKLLDEKVDIEKAAQEIGDTLYSIMENTRHKI